MQEGKSRSSAPDRRIAIHLARNFNSIKDALELKSVVGELQLLQDDGELDLPRFIKEIKILCSDQSLQEHISTLQDSSTISELADVLLAAKGITEEPVIHQIRRLQQREGETKHEYWAKLIRLYKTIYNPTIELKYETAQAFSRLRDPVKAFKHKLVYTNLEATVEQLIAQGILKTPSAPNSRGRSTLIDPTPQVHSQSQRRSSISSAGPRPSQVHSQSQRRSSISSAGPRPSQVHSKNRSTHDDERPKCTHCKRMGHFEESCWQKYPDLRPSAKRVDVLKEGAEVVIEEEDFFC